MRGAWPEKVSRTAAGHADGVNVYAGSLASINRYASRLAQTLS